MGVGLGTVVGTVVGGVATIPGVLVGGLVGAGAGVVHGPWIKLKKLAGADGGEEGEVKVPREALEEGSVVVDQKTGEVRAVDEERLKKARERAEKAEREGGGATGGGDGQVKKEKKKPRKLEVRKKA